MLSAYRGAETYQDQAIVRLRYRSGGRQFEDQAPVAVAWSAPNRLRVKAYQVEVVCDGDQLVARIQDPSTRDFDGQVVVRTAPQKLTLEQLWGEDEILSLAFRQGLAGYPLQLDLLLSQQPLAALMEQDVQRSLLAPAELDGQPCHRVEVSTPDGTFVLWIDQQSYVLRRIAYPAETFAAEIAADASVTDLQLTVECHNARFNQPAERSTFTCRIPPGAKQVTQLIPLPRELPSELFGKKTEPYQFQSLDGQTITSQSLGDHIKVFAWFNNHPACQSTIQQLNQVHQQYREQPNVSIRAVCAESSEVTDQQIESLARAWAVDLPIVRDVQALGRDLFEIPWAPTLVVLDGDNTVQIYEVGANPNLVAELPQVLEQLLAGVDVAGAILDQFREEQNRYEASLQRGRPETSASTAQAGPIASPSAPQLLQLRPLWENKDLTAVGNLLAQRDERGATRFFVHEGWRTVTEIGGQGSLLARHVLDLPARAAVGQLRCWTDSQGRRFYVGWSLRSDQAHVFDEQWNRQFSYPPQELEHEGIQDAMLSDLDGDGHPELHLGFWGTAGVHSVSLSGNRLWDNQEITHVLSLAVGASTDNRSTLWATSASGAVLQLDHHGRGERLAQHTGQLVHHLFRSESANQSETPFCAICYGAEGRRLALGLGVDAQSRWRYSLPSGAFSAPVRFVTSARLLDDRHSYWLIAGSDGTVHIISGDGRFTDHFATGHEILGLAGGRQDTAGILVVSHAGGLQAYQISPTATAAVFD
jgi:hypothetical protein